MYLVRACFAVVLVYGAGFLVKLGLRVLDGYWPTLYESKPDVEKPTLLW
jgi:hypothetical protein